MQQGGQRDSPHLSEFEAYLTVAHYCAVRAACIEQHNLVICIILNCKLYDSSIIRK